MACVYFRFSSLVYSLLEMHVAGLIHDVTAWCCLFMGWFGSWKRRPWSLRFLSGMVGVVYILLIFLLPELILYAMFNHKFSSLFFSSISCCCLCFIYVCCIYLYFSFSTLRWIHSENRSVNSNGISNRLVRSYLSKC